MFGIENQKRLVKLGISDDEVWEMGSRLCDVFEMLEALQKEELNLKLLREKLKEAIKRLQRAEEITKEAEEKRLQELLVFLQDGMAQIKGEKEETND